MTARAEWIARLEAARDARYSASVRRIAAERALAEAAEEEARLEAEVQRIRREGPPAE